MKGKIEKEKKNWRMNNQLTGALSFLNSQFLLVLYQKAYLILNPCFFLKKKWTYRINENYGLNTYKVVKFFIFPIAAGMVPITWVV